MKSIDSLFIKERDFMNTKAVLTSYIQCALWSSMDDSGEPLDGQYSEEDLSAETIEKMTADVERFVREAKDAIIDSGISESDIGHDFWLTRNGHGAGFWDRGLDKEVSDQFCKICDSFGSCELYLDDDNEIHIA